MSVVLDCFELDNSIKHLYLNVKKAKINNTMQACLIVQLKRVLSLYSSDCYRYTTGTLLFSLLVFFALHELCYVL